MDPVTHAAAGVLISQLLPGPARGWSALASVSFSLDGARAKPMMASGGQNPSGK
jgi:hypothetical protein